MAVINDPADESLRVFSHIAPTGERLRSETAGQGTSQKGGAENAHSRHGHGAVLPSCVDQHNKQPARLKLLVEIHEMFTPCMELTDC
jgi:hypothetical protein